MTINPPTVGWLVVAARIWPPALMSPAWIGPANTTLSFEPSLASVFENVTTALPFSDSTFGPTRLLLNESRLVNAPVDVFSLSLMVTLPS